MSRFSTVSKEQEDTIVKDMKSANTHRVTNVAWLIFTSYLKEKCINLDPSKISKEELDNILKTFYLEVRKVDGTMYRKNSFTSIRFGLERRFKEYRHDMCIISDTEFLESNMNFKAQCVQLKKNDLAKVDHKPAIAPEDVKRMYESNVLSLRLLRYRKSFF